MIENKIVDAGYNDALKEIKKKLNGYRRSWKRVYIGVTAAPKLRWEQHKHDGWHKMVLLYDAFTPKIARDMERAIIAHAEESNFVDLITNIGSGGEGISDESRSNYLYLLVADMRPGVIPF